MFRGSIPAVITPFVGGKVDYDSLTKVLTHLIDNGSHGLVPCGTTGESPTLSHDEHKKIIEETIRIADKRIPVIAGTGANATNEAIELSQEAKLKGADYVLLVTPYYNKPNQNGLIKHYEEIANKVDIPQILYNVPSRTACDLKPSSVEILSKHQNIIGIKEAVDDFQRIRELINITQISDDFSVFSGDDPTFLESMSLGAHGVISVAANVIPRSISMICRNVLNSELNEANNLNDINKNLYKLLFVESNPIPVKWMLFKMGLIKNIIRLPLIQLDETFHDEVVSELNKLRLI